MRRSALVIVLLVVVLMTTELSSAVLGAPVEREDEYGQLGFGEDQEESGLFGKIKAIPKKIGGFIGDKVKALREKMPG